MTLPDPPRTGATDAADDALERALRAWAAPTLPDDGFTQAVLQRVARLRGRPGLAPHDALQWLRVRQQQEARQLRLTGAGLALGVAVALTWLLVSAGGPGAGAATSAPWMLWLGAALAGSAGAVAWLLQSLD